MITRAGRGGAEGCRTGGRDAKNRLVPGDNTKRTTPIHVAVSAAHDAMPKVARKAVARLGRNSTYRFVNIHVSPYRVIDTLYHHGST